MRKFDERDVRKEFARRCVWWNDNVEIARGSTFGHPDVSVVIDGIRAMIPIEFKRGVVNKGYLMPSHVFPSQVSWHTDYQRVADSYFIVGSYHTNSVVLSHFLITAQLMLTFHRTGFNLASVMSQNGAFLELPIDPNARGKDFVYSNALKNFLSKR